jgi:acetyl esterase/lipase
VQDARAAYEGLLAQSIDPCRIALAGESAGGGLAVSTLLALREAGKPLPSCAFLMSPYADLTLSGETLGEKRDVDPVLTPDGLRVRVPDYLAGGDASDPYVSPIFGDLSGLPALLIQAGSHEILLSDALRLAGRAATADVPVKLEVTPGVPHVFQGFAALLDEAGEALDRASVFLRSHSELTESMKTPAPVS